MCSRGPGVQGVVLLCSRGVVFQGLVFQGVVLQQGGFVSRGVVGVVVWGDGFWSGCVPGFQGYCFPGGLCSRGGNLAWEPGEHLPGSQGNHLAAGHGQSPLHPYITE